MGPTPAKCHDVSCFVTIPMPPPKLCGSVPAYRSVRRVPFCSIPSAPPPPGAGRRDPFCARTAGARARVGAGAVRAPDCPRARRRTHVSRPLPAGVAKCHAMSCSPCFLRCFAVPFLHIVPPPRFVPLRSQRPTARRRDPDSRVSRARGRLSAPARFARLIARVRPHARAGRRAHLSRPLPRAFFAPAPARKGRRLRMPPPVLQSSRCFHKIKMKTEIFLIF